MKRAFVICRTISSDPTYTKAEYLAEEKGGCRKKIIEETMETFIKSISIQVWEALKHRHAKKTLERRNAKKSIPQHSLIKFLKADD